MSRKRKRYTQYTRSGLSYTMPPLWSSAKKRRVTGVSSAIAIAKRALKGVSALRSSIEWKLSDENVGAAVTNVGSITQLCTVPIGTDVDGRIGKKITLKKINLAFYCTKHITPPQSLVRIIVFVDKRQEIDAKTTVVTILDTAATLSPLNRFRIGRFKILFDQLVRLETNKNSWVFRKSLKVNINMEFNGVLGGDIDQNGLYILSLSDEAVNSPVLTYYVRSYFTDV